MFLFVNKMDQAGTDRGKLLEELKSKLDEGCIAFDVRTEALWEECSVCDDEALEEYLDHDCLKKDTIAKLIEERKVFPCYFGSALKLQGVRELLEGLQYSQHAETRTQSSYTEGSVFMRRGNGNRKKLENLPL